jgi:hypothetical protein
MRTEEHVLHHPDALPSALCICKLAPMLCCQVQAAVPCSQHIFRAMQPTPPEKQLQLPDALPIPQEPKTLQLQTLNPQT